MNRHCGYDMMKSGNVSSIMFVCTRSINVSIVIDMIFPEADNIVFFASFSLCVNEICISVHLKMFHVQNICHDN